MKSSDKFLVINQRTAATDARYDNEADALSDAARRAAKEGDVYLVFKAIAKVQTKPADVETIKLG